MIAKKCENVARNADRKTLPTDLRIISYIHPLARDLLSTTRLLPLCNATVSLRGSHRD